MKIRSHRASDAVVSAVASRSPQNHALMTAHTAARAIRPRATGLRTVSLTAAIYTIAFTAFAQSPDTSAAREIARVDTEYSKLSVAKGMPAASVENFAEHGVAFAAGVVNGKKYWASRAEFPGTLIWQPIFAFAAAADDLGFTTGPWELKKGNGEPSLGYGHYVTIWSKQRDGKWKIALDVGTENSEPREPPPNLEVQPSDISAATRQPEDARRELQKAEHKFTELARDDIGKAIIGSAADDIRIYRDKAFPAIGLVATRLMLESEHGQVTFQPGGSKMSKSGDLYYSYGNYSEERGNVVEQGIYLTIWRANMNGDWKLVVNLQKKFPPSKKQ
jgi:ketosteroid isomerase-like protein